MTTNIDQIKAILFDFGGTIDYDGQNWAIRLWNILREGQVSIEQKKFIEAADQAMNILSSDNESSKLSYLATVDIFIYWTLKNMDIVVEDYKKVLVAPFYQASNHSIQKNKKIFEALKKKYQLGIITNNFGNCRGWCKEINIEKYFELIIDSTIVNRTKPSQDIFKLALDRLSLKAHETAYVGDKYEIDITPTFELKMLPIWINSYLDEKNNIHNVIRIKKLEELKKIFNIPDNQRLLL